jgi:alanyl-tRNA synthetase
MHAALRAVLGDHVVQQGSYVGPDRLRFDFSHPRAVTPEELEEIERIVNAQVFQNRPVSTTVEDLAAAKARGVVALFGEKYEDRVRVVDVPGFSTELCGGTHVAAAGDIGPFVIASEGAIQAGVRRIEALTGPAAVAFVQVQRGLLRRAAQLLKSAPADVPGRVEQLQSQVKEARKASKAGTQADVAGAFARVKHALADRGGVLCGVVALDVDQGGLRDLAGRVKALQPSLAVVLLGRAGDRVPWIALVQGDAGAHGLTATDLVPVLQEHLGGGGGGKADLAQGQGQVAAGVDAAVQALEERLSEAITP